MTNKRVIEFCSNTNRALPGSDRIVTICEVLNKDRTSCYDKYSKDDISDIKLRIELDPAVSSCLAGCASSGRRLHTLSRTDTVLKLDSLKVRGVQVSGDNSVMRTYIRYVDTRYPFADDDGKRDIARMICTTGYIDLTVGSILLKIRISFDVGDIIV